MYTLTLRNPSIKSVGCRPREMIDRTIATAQKARKPDSR